MPAIGITGGIATGKSSFVICLRELMPDAHSFDADAMARELTRSDEAVRAEIREMFGFAIFSSSGELNRAALRAIVFGAPEKRRMLESILHPRIRQHWSGEAIRHRNSFYLADIPLLYETGGETLCDVVVTVACAAEVQLQRLMERTAIEREAATAIVAAQMPLTEKVNRSDHVVWNNGPKKILAEQAEALVNLWTNR